MANTVKEYSDDLVNHWNGEIDALLTYVSMVYLHRPAPQEY